jgi:hypothetical protein
MTVMSDKPTTKSKSKSVMRPFYVEIGRATVEWNALHEMLARLLSSLIDPPHAFPRIAHAIWYGLGNDRLQRKILLEVARAKFWKADDPEHRRVREENVWLIVETDKLSELRNDLTHAPIGVRSTIEIGPHGFKLKDKVVRADDNYGHERAARLNKRNLTGAPLLDRVKLAAEWSSALSKFAWRITFNLLDRRQPWPTRPAPPNRGQKNAPAKRSRQPRARLRKKRHWTF